MSQSNYTRKTCDVVRRVAVSQPAVPLTVVEVIGYSNGEFDVFHHVCVGIETRHIREYSLVVHKNEPERLGGPRPTRFDARTMREEGWRFECETVEHNPMFIDSEFGIVSTGDGLVCGAGVAFFVTTRTGEPDPDYDAKMANAKLLAGMRPKREAGAA